MSSKLNRFNGWVAVIAFSSVVLGTLVTGFEDPVDRPRYDYIISTCSIAIGLGFISFCGYLFTDSLVGGWVEASMGTIVFALWCACIGVIQNPDNQFATERTNILVEVTNTNLYFFSWAAFLSSAYVITSLAQEHRLVDVTAASTKLIRWYLFLIASVIVFGTASNLKPTTCPSAQFSDEVELCQRTKYAVSFGVISAGLAIIPIVWSHFRNVNSIVELVVAIIVTVFYCVGAAYITDAKNGPGGNIGNLYFSTWFGFGMSVLLTCSCLKLMFAPEEAPVTEEEGENLGKTESKQGDVVAKTGGGDEVEPVGQRGGEAQLEDVDVEGEA